VKHWVKYSDDSAGPSVYRELSDDIEDEDFDDLYKDSTPISRVYQHHLEKPSDTVVHVHHVHEVHDDVVDVGSVIRSATASVALDDNDELSSSVTQRTSSGDEQQRSNNEQSRAHTLLNYDVEEGLA